MPLSKPYIMLALMQTGNWKGATTSVSFVSLNAKPMALYMDTYGVEAIDFAHFTCDGSIRVEGIELRGHASLVMLRAV
jgi:hypothetical protein